MRLLRRGVNPDGFSEGARLFWIRLEALGLTQTQAEEQLGVDGTGQVNRILYGERKPGRALAARLAAAPWGIRLETWDEPPSQPFEPPGARTGTDG